MQQPKNYKIYKNNFLPIHLLYLTHDLIILIIVSNWHINPNSSYFEKLDHLLYYFIVFRLH